MLTERLPLARMAAYQGPLSFGSDRRSQPRVGFDCPMHWVSDGAERFGWARDASEGGASFTVPTSTAPKIGDTLKLVFRLDNCCDWLVSARAQVAWRQETHNGMCHIGVRRVDPTETTPYQHRQLFQWA